MLNVWCIDLESDSVNTLLEIQDLNLQFSLFLAKIIECLVTVFVNVRMLTEYWEEVNNRIKVRSREMNWKYGKYLF